MCLTNHHKPAITNDTLARNKLWTPHCKLHFAAVISHFSNKASSISPYENSVNLLGSATGLCHSWRPRTDRVQRCSPEGWLAAALVDIYFGNLWSSSSRFQRTSEKCLHHISWASSHKSVNWVLKLCFCGSYKAVALSSSHRENVDVMRERVNQNS